MFADLIMISSFMLYAMLGAITRALFGIYRAYTTTIKFRIDWKRVCIEIVASMFFGSFASIILQEIGAVEVSQIIAALIAGFLGADLIGLITKKIGLTRSMKVIVTQEQMEMLGLNERQRKAIEYLNKHGTITNDVYQELTKASHSSAKRDLKTLVEKKKVKKAGSGKSTYYFI